MSSERWQKIDQLFHAALEQDASQRTAFVSQACGADHALQSEIESLLASHQEADGFIETPAADVAADLLVDGATQLTTGQSVGPYRIDSLLGEGGMGEVYLADDIRLNRKIALKLLPPHFTVNPDRVRRFEREARAASALNHPNIVTIYEIGQSDSAHFIATEFVDGKTLRQMINEQPLKLSETLNVAIQVAGALMGAHAAGIVHRDIKPENIMVRSDGYVKILDFGLAKLTEQQTAETETETPTLLQSNPGLVMGTVQYMSPEQARGKKVDARSDIWSFGIVLFELLAGRVPFAGETPSHVMVSLMEDELPPLTTYADVPAELDRIVTKALGKKPRERYQTASELARDLKNLKQELQLEARLKGVLETVPTSNRRTTKSDGQTGAQASSLAAVATETVALQARPTSTAEYLVREIKTHRTLALAASIVVLLTAIGLTYFFWNRTNSSKGVTPISASANPTPNHGTANEEAYRYYLQGKNLTNQRTAETHKKAIENFEQAIRIDPNFARAYAGLANVYHLGGTGGPRMEGTVWRVEQEKAKQAVKKALELDSNLAEAYAVRGSINTAYEWDFAAAEKDLTTALQLEPNNDIAHFANALLCAYRGSFEQALKEIETALTIAPGAVGYESERGKILYFARRYDEAITQFARSIELQRGAGSIWLSRAYEMKGDYAAAFEAFLKTEKDPQRVEAYRAVYETAGWQGVQRKFIEFSKLDEQQGKAVNHYKMAITFAQLGEKEQALVYLNKLVAERSWQIPMLLVDPQVDPLRGDPRFEKLLKFVRR
jgi:serine/threonine protein kinase